MNHKIAENAVSDLLTALGENPDREGLRETPSRVATAWEVFTEGARVDVQEMLGEAIFHERYDEMVVVRDIDFYSICEHHLIPFFGKCHIGYLPDKKIVGISKLMRAVEIISRNLQVQERMTLQIAEAIESALQPKGVAVLVEGFHLCTAMRGVQKANSTVTTSTMLGAFRGRDATRNEFLSLIGRDRPINI